MTTTMVCDRCGKKPRRSTYDWIVLRVATQRSPETTTRTIDLCGDCAGIFNEAVSKPRRTKPKNVVPLRALQSS